jgi:hypothetical protein
MIYFDNNKQAYAFEIENPIAQIQDNIWEQYCSTDKWDIVEGVFTDITNTPEYIAKKEQEEQERIGDLTLTKRVFALALQNFGITYTQLKALIATSDQAQMEWDLCERLERKNPLLDAMVGGLGITPEQLDQIFIQANEV